VSQSQAGVDHEADYRALTKDGNFVWIRDVVHVVRDAKGEVKSLVGFMFDISERKEAEEKILLLQKELESLSFKDGLTGVANRRMFDSIFEREWGNARRDNQPLSLIILDIDCFKLYNDRYGHFQGDEVLKRVAAGLLQSYTSGARTPLARASERPRSPSSSTLWPRITRMFLMIALGDGSFFRATMADNQLVVVRNSPSLAAFRRSARHSLPDIEGRTGQCINR
jgi:hypothetical protein